MIGIGSNGIYLGSVAIYYLHITNFPAIEFASEIKLLYLYTRLEGIFSTIQYK